MKLIGILLLIFQFSLAETTSPGHSSDNLPPGLRGILTRPSERNFNLSLTDFYWTDENGHITRAQDFASSERTCRSSSIQPLFSGDNIDIAVGPGPLASKPPSPPLGYILQISTNTNAMGFNLTITDAFVGGKYTRLSTYQENGMEIQEKMEVVVSPFQANFNPRRDILNIKSIHVERRRGGIGSSFDSKPEVIRRVVCTKEDRVS